MRLAELALAYGVVGLGCALVLAVGRARARASIADVALLACLWPLYGPFVLSQAWGDAAGLTDREVAFLAALRRARGTPLARLLPDEHSVRRLGERVRVAAGKVREIDSLLARPEFGERQALARQAELVRDGGSETTQSTLAIRLQNIRRLRRLRDRFARELEEIEELLHQLRTQVEVVRLAGVADDDAGELVLELVSRVEGLDRVLDDDPAGVGPLVLPSASGASRSDVSYSASTEPAVATDSGGEPARSGSPPSPGQAGGPPRATIPL
jgi:hypothetical protein